MTAKPARLVTKHVGQLKTGLWGAEVAHSLLEQAVFPLQLVQADVLFNTWFLLQLEFSPQTLCCYGKQLCTIPRDATYYSYQNR